MTPEEIVALIGNIANRPDLRETQERQVKEIKKLIKKAKEDVGLRQPCCRYCACPCH